MPEKSTHQITPTELHEHEVHLAELKAKLEAIQDKVEHHKKLSKKDVHFISHLGWLSTLSVTIAAIASNI